MDGRTVSKPMERSQWKVPRSFSVGKSGKSDITPPLDSESVDHECPSGDDPPSVSGSASALKLVKLKSSVSVLLVVDDNVSVPKDPSPLPKSSKSSASLMGSSIFRAIKHMSIDHLQRKDPRITYHHSIHLSSKLPLEWLLWRSRLYSGLLIRACSPCSSVAEYCGVRWYFETSELVSGHVVIEADEPIG